jgi:hypothetical protein
MIQARLIEWLMCASWDSNSLLPVGSIHLAQNNFGLSIWREEMSQKLGRDFSFQERTNL